MPYLTSEVFEGADGHLFLAKGSNNVVDLFSQGVEKRQRLVSDWMDVLSRRHGALARMGITYRHCFVPDKLSIYRGEARELWANLSSPTEEIERYAVSTCPFVVPLTEYLRRQKTKHPIFFKTDTHWTIEGCFSAYQMLCASLGLEQRRDLILTPAAPTQLMGDLGSKTIPQRMSTFKYGRFGRSAQRVGANELVTLRESGILANHVGLHVGSSVHFINDGQVANVRVLLFGDSFSEYRLHYLTGLLADTVRELMFVWSTNLDYDLVQDFLPQIVISEVAERFIVQLPSDDVDIRAHASHKVQQALNT